jgi:hypothetical protein
MMTFEDCHTWLNRAGFIHKGKVVSEAQEFILMVWDYDALAMADNP